MYEETAERYNLAPQEVEILAELLESRAWEVLLDVQERFISDPAHRILNTTADFHEMLRKQGVLQAFRELDGIMKGIYNGVKEEKDLEKEEEMRNE